MLWAWSMIATTIFNSCTMATDNAAPIFPKDSLLDKNGEPVAFESLKGKIVALYFGAEWCPMTTRFSPTLDEFYNKHSVSMHSGEAKLFPFEVVFVSSDSSSEQYIHHRTPFPWLSVDLNNPLTGELKKKYRVWAKKESQTFGQDRRSGIPALVVIDSVGTELLFIDAEEPDATLKSIRLDDQTLLFSTDNDDKKLASISNR